MHAAATNIQDELINRENDCIPRRSPPKMHVQLTQDRRTGGEGGLDESDEGSSGGVRGPTLAMSGAGGSYDFERSTAVAKLDDQEDGGQRYGGHK